MEDVAACSGLGACSTRGGLADTSACRMWLKKSVDVAQKLIHKHVYMNVREHDYTCMVLLLLWLSCVVAAGWLAVGG